mgnify:CR=1 FL=1
MASRPDPLADALAGEPRHLSDDLAGAAALLPATDGPAGAAAALIALAAKEALFRYMLHVGESLRSPMLIANAWHARSDAASSLVVLVGSLTVSYAKARAEGLGIECNVGFAERTERMLVIALGL